MRFTLHTSDGLGFVVKDRGKVIARGVIDTRIRRVIQKRISGDAWRPRIQWMCQQWNGSANQHHKSRLPGSEWNRWAEIRRLSWNDRGRAMTNMIRRGDYFVKHSAHSNAVCSRLRCNGEYTWDRALKHLCTNYQTAWSKQDEWSKWATNTASNQRKRMRVKEEKAIERS